MRDSMVLPVSPVCGGVPVLSAPYRAVEETAGTEVTAFTRASRTTAPHPRFCSTDTKKPSVPLDRGVSSNPVASSLALPPISIIASRS